MKPSTPATIPSVVLPVKTPRRRTSGTTKFYLIVGILNLIGGIGSNWNLISGVFWCLTAYMTHHNEGKAL